MIIEITVITAVNMFIGKFLTAPTSKLFLGSSAESYFPYIFYVPILVFILCVLLKVSPLKTLDFTVLMACIALIFFKIACFCEGCCYGIEYPTHFYNHYTERYEIPVQLIELACAILMFVILLIMRKRKKKDGFMYPTFMLMYCGSRFCSEFLRDDYPAIIGRMTGYHVQCIIGFVLGLIYLIVVLKFGERITDFFESKNKAFYKKRLKIYNQKYPYIASREKK